ncbi:MAG: cytochrome c [Planctomycetaceae bacterium]|jgi:protein tyrosine phosphatase (PTP) superfamily phosphohydrolase (DUF442 family)|nr:cytochrome c [Planctomycetaceae bacterium]MBT6155185.1 cytochrome c [Planctomycetaceae bacterium]MBT6483299.1 cytochrome c [Planctomycetaceae bacterium]MBT6494626.1 cytochrome c [Planctomycetaceae bacterium]
MNRYANGGASRISRYLTIPLICILFAVGCQDTPESEPVPTATGRATIAADSHVLHNLLEASDGIYSGSEPASEEAFVELKNLGVKTIVSVDGARPRVEQAKNYGMRYIHIPFGYDGIPDEAGKMLARAMQDVEKPIYIHCHHGNHRGPAAAAVMCRAAGKMNTDQAREFLEHAGTSKKYAGLWRDVSAYESPAKSDNLPELVEVAKVDSLVAAMASIGHTWDRLKLIEAAEWKTPADHPDLVPAQEALLLKEAFHEAVRNLPTDYDDAIKEALGHAEIRAASLETAIGKNDTETAGKELAALEASCKSCHTAHRN